MDNPPNPQFPLLSLPFPMLRKTINSMLTLEKLCYSLLFDDIKDLVKSTIKPAREIEVTIQEKIRIHAHIWDLPPIELKFRDVNLGETIPLTVPDTVMSTNHYALDTVPHSMNRPDFSVRQWILFYQDIFKCENLTVRFLATGRKYGFNSIVEALQGFKIGHIFLHESLGPDYGRLVLENFLPVKRITFVQLPPVHPEFLLDVLSQRFDMFEIRDQRIFHLELDQILAMTSPHIELVYMRMPIGLLNNLLKRWIDGWNLELKAFACGMELTDDRIRVLNDIDCEEVPEDQIREGHFEHVILECLTNQKRYDIVNKNGVRGTVFFGNNVLKPLFKFCVYH